MQDNPNINLNIVNFQKASLLIKATDMANKNHPMRSTIPEEELLKRSERVIVFLLDRGVDIDYRDKNGYTALLSAAHWKHPYLC